MTDPMDDVHETSAVIDNGSFGTRTIRFETGRLARQAAGSVVAYLDDETMLLSATTASKQPKEHFDFFPLTVDVEERMYAIGKIPGSFFRREGRPGTDAVLTCRLIDRPLRPSFVDGLRNEIQIVVTVMSLDPQDPYDALAINAASMSTQLSGLPFSGPIGGVRVALIDGQWIAFPQHEDLQRAVFDMVVAGRVVGDDVAIMMVEAEATTETVELVAGGAQAPTEQVVAAGLEAAKPFIRSLCVAQQQLADVAAKPTREYPTFPAYQPDVFEAVEAEGSKDLAAALTIGPKQEREAKLDEVKLAVLTALGEKFEGREKELGAAFRALNKKLVRQRILRDQVRIDGRGITDIRPLSAEVEVVPRAHGSALFERGETQIMGVTTLNMLRMEQQIDSLGPETHKRYLHHYNFPPYSTGETGRVGSPKRREIGHGALAERALLPVLPTREEFPYAIRQVSEALGSNGSTSMGSVCASTMSLFNAGVPLKAPVAGIAMGLVSDEVEGQTRYVALTDILGAEDAFGDMDFKVAGTSEFVTALQLDTKLDGIPSEVLAAALSQAKDARLTILEVIGEAIDRPDEMSQFAPRVTAIKVPVDKIGEVIGPKGKMINSITEQTGADISIEDDGTIYVGAADGPSAEQAIGMINAIANPQLPKIGERFLGTVVKTAAFGAFVSLVPGKDGLVHISKLGQGKRIAKVEDVVKVGDKIRVEVTDIDNRGKISLVPVGEDSENGAAPAAVDTEADTEADADAEAVSPS
ncbi:polyribonucleotide nucleotidyltransferase [Pseudonocardia kunmingensis]|uniref:Polyribonucleotide nucleotidyltransferase n=1 Tax=Pseudonocardia kunmingensis TaxID=630975 RepID=A0A543DYJ9_9PSEU|nr:polyribonucleotide nucleotidyltransferase [Pseudonocardia kunmingensis]TQM14394.1 polyribonucleotide nucleotidyltransferase [Pseudonocardia kunmingensis]